MRIRILRKFADQCRSRRAARSIAYAGKILGELWPPHAEPLWVEVHNRELTVFGYEGFLFVKNLEKSLGRRAGCLPVACGL